VKQFGPAVVLIGALCQGAALAAGASPDFDRDIRPILSDKCFFCHGPDAERREGGLRLDSRAGAIESAIEPGNPDGSELIARITSPDESTRMPPPESGLALSIEEKSALRQWIADGAKYAEHWAFEPLPQDVAVPVQRHSSWPRNEIDHFVLSRLQSEQLAPTAPAPPLRLLRRLSFDLTGLPPSLEEIEEFERAAQVDVDAAIADAANRYLASPAFGEHQAVAWLDAARYADSFGYQSDQLNSQWPYRDWVVRAFNDGLPYDDFLTWQLAGDLLNNPTVDQRLATAFNRLHRMTNEGGSIAEEWLIENAADRVHTFGSAVLGLTLECARCHDHKYDPIQSRDYYSIMAFFNSIDENGMYDHSAKTPAPSLLLPTADQQRRLAEASARVDAAERELTLATRNGGARFAAWLESARKEGLRTEDKAADAEELVSARAIPDLAAHFTFDHNEGGSVAGNSESLPQFEATHLQLIEGYRGQAVQCDGDNAISFPNSLRVERYDPFTLMFWMRDSTGNPQPVVVAHRSFGTDVGYNGFDLMLADGRLEARFYRVWPGNGIGVRAERSIARDQWRHVAVTYDGSSQADGFRIYLDGQEVETTILRDKIWKSASIATHGSGVFTLGQRFRDRGFAGGAFDELRVYARALTPLEVSVVYSDAAGEPGLASNQSPASFARALAPQHALRETYLSAYDAPIRAATEKLHAARKELVAAEEPIHEVSVMEELDSPRPAYVLARGAYDSPKSAENLVSRGVFADMLPPFPPDAPKNRLGLAQWLTAPDHPLTARVFVNRTWANFFGRGLSNTPDNFGRQGSAPSHPELLDWLARDFVDHGWDVKRLCRQIVNSAVYRQDSRTTFAMRQRDPDNLLLARGPSRRLTAEQLRDLALSASGLLVPKVGGPPTYPYQPGDDLWRESNSMSPSYTQSSGDDLRRRSLYSVWKRTSPLPNMSVFDAPTREVCTIERGRTSTPLQALVLLNDIQFVEASRALATEASLLHADVDGRLAEAFLRLTSRRPDRGEATALRNLFNEQLSHFMEHPAAANQLLQVGELPLNETLPPAELAALTVACQAILNLDASVYER
jgi:hypothetical protein